MLNNQILGYQKHAETLLFGEYSDACDFQSIDHAAIVRACGCDGMRIEQPGQFLPALRQALVPDRTAIFDVVTDPGVYPPVTMFEGSPSLAGARHVHP